MKNLSKVLIADNRIFDGVSINNEQFSFCGSESIFDTNNKSIDTQYLYKSQYIFNCNEERCFHIQKTKKYNPDVKSGLISYLNIDHDMVLNFYKLRIFYQLIR